MSPLTFFVTSCNSCRKKNQFEIGCMGRAVQCRFCGCGFSAVSVDSTSAALDDPLHYWIHFTEHPLAAEEPPCDAKDLGRTPR
jgi:hypothetical protein